MPDFKILRPEEILSEIPESYWLEMPLYNQPAYSQLIKPGRLRFGCMESEEGLSFFPFSTDRILLQRRVFMLPYCQRFTPFTLDGNPPSEASQLSWLNWLEQHTFRCRWAFSGKVKHKKVIEKTNQILHLQQGAESLISAWKKGRRGALSKSESLQVLELRHENFKLALTEINQKKNGKAWKPSSFEKAAILRISSSSHFAQNVQRFAVMDGKDCLSLVLVLKWGNRWHYLFSQSSERGFQCDSLTRFFYYFLQTYAGKPEIFDFEGSSIPGVNAYFTSLGAETELYLEYGK